MKDSRSIFLISLVYNLKGNRESLPISLDKKNEKQGIFVIMMKKISDFVSHVIARPQQGAPAQTNQGVRQSYSKD